MQKLIFVILLLLPLLSVGQISVKSFKKLPMDMTARTFEPKQDQNGEVCAIIRVVTTEKGFAWEPDGFGIVDAPYKVGEYWLYVPGGAQRITIRHEKLGRLVNYHYPEPIEKGCVYEMVLTTAKITTIVEEVLNNYLVISAEPSDAVIYFENKMVGVGAYQALCKPGVYTYRVESPLYHTEAGRIEMGTDKKILAVNLKPAFGYLNISTEPENGAIITIDGERLNGVSPMKTERLKSGEHTVSAVQNMYRPTTQKVMVTDGQTTPVILQMKPDFATLTVTTGTTGGEIYLNDAKVGDTQWTGRANVGLNGVEVRKAHHRSAKQEVELAAGIAKSITLEPLPIKGNLNITTTPINATIRIAGKEYGTTPNIITGLLEGNYTVELSKSGCASENRNVTIVEGKTTELNVTLISGMSVTLTTNPEGADLWLDGKPVGKSPQTLDMSFGEYTFKGRLEHEIVEQKIRIAQGEKSRFELELNPQPKDAQGRSYSIKKVSFPPLMIMTENIQDTRCGKPDRVFGRVYTWEEAKTICPAGWHVPNAYEWEDIITTLGDDVDGVWIKEYTFQTMVLPSYPDGIASYWSSSSAVELKGKRLASLFSLSGKRAHTMNGNIASEYPVRCIKAIERDDSALSKDLLVGPKDAQGKLYPVKQIVGTDMVIMVENMADTLLGKDNAPYGRCYTWKEAMKVCPEGWHVPYPKEWANIAKALGSNPQKTWMSEYGFQLGGMNGEAKGEEGHYWSRDYSTFSLADELYLTGSRVRLDKTVSYGNRLSVRCIRD